MPNHVNNCALFHIYYALLYRLLHGRNLGQFREWGVISQQWYQSNFPYSGIRADGSVGDLLSEEQSGEWSRSQPKGVIGGASSRKLLDGGAGRKLKQNPVRWCTRQVE